MKTIIAFVFVILLVCACTENQRVRNFGGSQKVILPKGERLIMATWKNNDLWYLTEPMPQNYIPKEKKFHESSDFGALQGTVIFIEQE